ncbi:hypothetical protein OVY01_10935 [Robbsia sp. Bb-Pol-6]|uniref:Lipoprotein SmpA/OmlA domain-containing protein n=1 Tax=Robbsia betulipollinis TaxID=2981849 RepID=A0ABT3ZP78_9BURK|nr:hypothetical protein [Robbsia betulipollinis]MCY0387740.1 hypothetical protein [Robbsia betulipollinis]
MIVPVIAARGACRGAARLGSRVAALLLVGALGACAAPWQRFTAGEDASRVTAALGSPKESYPLPDGGHRWLWPTRPFGETTTAADVDAAGRLVSIRQVLTNESFAQVVVGQWTREDVQRHFGLPEETAYYPLMRRAVWSYRYMDADVWYMLYHFYFDDAGIVRSTQKTPDPLHDPDRHFGNF